MTTAINITDLKTLWERTLGTPPSEQQFIIWSESHDAKIVRRAILKTAQKNLSVGSTMCEDHKVRFASKVMLTSSALCSDHAANRERLRQEMEGRTA